ncbi:MAG: PD-(D/E)XK nuclease family protein [Rickettsiales bacterium]
MPNLFTIPAGEPIARLAAAHILVRHTPDELAHAILFVPNRRSSIVLRDAFAKELAGRASLLPRILPLADIGNELLTLLGDRAFALLDTIPPAMPLAQQRYMLTQQVAIFERKHRVHVTLDYALTMAEALMELQEAAARAGTPITIEKLQELRMGFAEHWQDAHDFLAILATSWPAIERELGTITPTTRELMLLDALANEWTTAPPEFPVYAIGSTASQHSTARLLKAIADAPNGQVILPGIDPTMDEAEWTAITCGHPLYHLKHFLNLWPLTPAEITPLATTTRRLWLEALAPAEFIPAWPSRELPAHQSLKLIPCAQPEEELRVISLLIREAIENPNAHVALITPDESLLAQAASHMKRYDISVDRLNAGTLATTRTGSAWTALIAAIAEPERQLPLRSLLHHPLLAIDAELLKGLEKGWHGLNRSYAGQLPRHDADLNKHTQYAALSAWVKSIAQLSNERLSASAWVDTCRTLLAQWVPESGQGHEAVEMELAALSFADSFGAMPIEDFTALLTDSLSTPWRDAGINTHPRIHFLTPVEARLQHFDRTILANMVDELWPGNIAPNPWLNLAAQKALHLPEPAERTSLLAHDVLMLASSGEVFITYPERAGGSPTTRSRFIERVATLLASHNINEADITADNYRDWAQALYTSQNYTPEQPVRPMPSSVQRPRRLPVTQIEKLFSDPFTIYARHVLGLKRLDEIDMSPEASDFGNLTHKAIERLSVHWTEQMRPATESELADITQRSLRELSERPNIDLFWRARLMNGLHYVNHLEATRREHLRDVKYEQEVEQPISLPSGEIITLHGRIDRIETEEDSLATIIDHKTGTAPTEKEILDGRAPQLLAYAMLLQRAGHDVAAVEYWSLPRLGTTGNFTHVEINETITTDFEAKLAKALAQMLEEGTPFLARPTGGEDRFGNDYNGISRYDEWAG